MLIGVTGGSGSGKSTVTNYLKENVPNCIAINLDEFMRIHCNEHRDEIISKLNLNIGNDFWSTHLVNNYEEIAKWVKIIEKDIEASIRSIISESENEGCKKNIILDWAFLPLLPIYNECDFSVLVKCDLDIKLGRLVKRLEKHNKLEKWNHALEKRMKNTALEEHGHSATYMISNNGTLEELEQSIESILKSANINL